MKKVITYGTYDLFHEGHYNLLKNAKSLGDYLIVGVTSDHFDRLRGKFNVRESLMQRIENVRATGFADEIIVEEYFGQKIDDIRKFNVDIFTVGSDWKGYFDYLNEYCEVHYLPRTDGISSTQIRKSNTLKLGIIGNEKVLDRLLDECAFVTGIEVVGAFTEEKGSDLEYRSKKFSSLKQYDSLEELIASADAIYINLPLSERDVIIDRVLEGKRHVLTEFPFSTSVIKAKELLNKAKDNNLVLMEGLKTAYAPAFTKMIAIARSGQIGKLLNVEANFTQVLGEELSNQIRIAGGSVLSLGAYPLLAIFKLLGFNYKKLDFVSYIQNEIDILSKINLIYEDSMGSATIAINAKAEGDMVVSGSKGYIYIPAPWWKTEYFELRFEDTNRNQKYFYKFEGEGLRYELIEFQKCINDGVESFLMSHSDILEEVKVLEAYTNNHNVTIIA